MRQAFREVVSEKSRAQITAKATEAAMRKRWAVASKEHLLSFVRLTHPGYLAGEFHKRVCAALERFSAAVTRGESPRMILVAPPRHGKTEVVSMRFPVWHMARNPGHSVICASYAAPLAVSNSRRARSIARNAVEVWPELRVGEAIDRDAIDTAEMWELSGGGRYRAAGVDGGISGFGAHIFIGDDLLKGWDQASSPAHREKVWNWFLADAKTRVAPGGGILIMLTRWHADDLVGRLETVMQAGGERYEVLHFEALSTGTVEGDWRQVGEALHPERYPADRLRLIQADGATVFEALYQGRPIAVGGGMFRASLWNRYTGDPKVLARQAIEVALTIDCANEGHAGACFSVIHVVGKFKAPEGIRVRVLGEYRGQWELPELTQAYERALTEWPMVGPVYIEYAANGIALHQIESRKRPGLVAVKPRGDESYPGGSKEARAAFTLQGLESGAGPELPDDAYAVSETGENFAVGIINEHAMFPAGKLKDRVDTLSQYMIRVLVRQGQQTHTVADRRKMFGL